MNKLAKQVSPEELAHQVTQYLLVLRDISVKLDGYREINEKYPGWVRSAVMLKRQWLNFIAHGRDLAWAILGSKEIPKGQEKSIEISARLFTVSNRMPNDPIGWFDKNFPRLQLLYQAGQKWPDKTDADSEQKFRWGAFTIHNTVALTGAPLEKIKDALKRAEVLVKASPVPGIEKVLYGDVMIVAKINKGNVVAFYTQGEDVVYLRPSHQSGTDEIEALIHELGHRYLSKFMDHKVKANWARYHNTLPYLRGEPGELPKEGEPFPFPIKGLKGPTFVQKIEGDKFFVNENGYITKSAIERILENKTKYPTAYAAKDYEEHFCEALALNAMGHLKDPHLSAFKNIIVDNNYEAWSSAAVKKVSSHRVAARYRHTQSSFAGDEVFTDAVKKSIKDFIHNLIVEGQSVANVVQKQRDWAVKNVAGGDKLTDGQMVAETEKLVEYQWGDDAMARPLARLIALGDYLW